ncbi:MAG: lytic transglycosylase domain-containing protein, partial [Polynucleobacter sp.]|nr:lytic transglycosylase domain-containing protein [Polynucleobacter sp.]
NPLAVGKNENGTVDVGIGQHNSMHFKELKRVGFSPEDLKDACIGTYVAAWHLSKSLAKHGNTWFAVATYHSATPYFNKRYQVLIQNELIRSGVISGSISKVPPFKRGGVSSKNASVTRMRSTQDQVVAAGTSNSVAFDSSP